MNSKYADGRPLETLLHVPSLPEVTDGGTGRGPELGAQRSWHLSLHEAVVMVQRWATGRRKARALLQGAAAPECGFEPVGLSASGLPG